jgi:catechol 2,3-dioxygenase-like lactoylglutathione lyase family enzyme
MSECRISGLRSIELGVTDMERSTRFYCANWGLQQVSAEEGVRYFRADGAEHHVLCLRQQSAAKLLGITLAAANPAAVDALYAQARECGVTVAREPGPLPHPAGGGYGLALTGPEALMVTVSCDVAAAAPADRDRSRPSKLAHVVINSGDVPAQLTFFIDLLGFRVSDSTDRMQFLRCGTDHHTIALAYGDALSLNHAAFDMADIDGLMYGAGRLTGDGYNIEWGLGRHGPGNNVFTYFIDPEGFVIEYTTEMEQIDESAYVAHDAAYWSGFANRPCRWGVARKPSERLMAAMAGKNLAKADPAGGNSPKEAEQ